MSLRITRYFAVHRYPEYVTDLLIVRIMFACCCYLANFSVGKGTRVRGMPIVSLVRGSSILIGSHAYLISRSRNTVLGVSHSVVLRTMRVGAKIVIGDHFSASGVTICAAQEIVIGDRVMMGANVTVVDTDFHSADPVVRFSSEDARQAKSAPVRIEDEVFIGMGAMILKGVTVGARAIIGAGAVVSRSVPAGAVVGGNPARIISAPSFGEM